MVVGGGGARRDGGGKDAGGELKCVRAYVCGRTSLEDTKKQKRKIMTRNSKG